MCVAVHHDSLFLQQRCLLFVHSDYVPSVNLPFSSTAFTRSQTCHQISDLWLTHCCLMSRLLTLSIPPPPTPGCLIEVVAVFPTVFCLWDLEQKILHQQVAGFTSAVQSSKAAMSARDRASRYFLSIPQHQHPAGSRVLIQSFGTP